MFYFTCGRCCNSAASSEKDEIAPQSQIVYIRSDGFCVWEPLFQWSASHCAFDNTWFPFDEQECSLIYESWKYRADEMNFIAHAPFDDTEGGIVFMDFSPNGLWEIVGKLKSVPAHVYNIVKQN